MLFNLYAHTRYFLLDFYSYLILIVASFITLVTLSFKIYKIKTSQRRKRILVSLVFTLFITILVFSSVEAYFRYVYDQSDGLGFLRVNSKWHQRHVVYNSYFFRDRDFSPNRREGVVRIGVLGDSIAFGAGIKNVDDRFSNILEEKLKDSGYNVEVYNLGKLGYDTEGEIQVYKGVKNLNFDIIVWEYFLNDIQPIEHSTGTAIISKESEQAKLAKFVSAHSFFLDFLYWRISSRYQKTFVEIRRADIDRYKDQERLLQHKQEIAQFIKGLKDDNKKILVIIFPSMYFIGPNYPAADIHTLMGNYFRDQGVETIDLLNDLKGKDAKSLIAGEFDPHPNEYVHHLAAERVFEKVKTLLKQVDVVETIRLLRL